MNIGRVLAGLTVCVAAASGQPATVHACSCAAAVLYGLGHPADGATQVPLNQAVVVQGMLVADSIVLEDDAGQSVDFTLNAGPTPGCPGTWAELIPKQPFKPNTRYTVRVQPDPKLSSTSPPATVTFTTGTEMHDDENLTTPVGRASTLLHVRDGFGCGPSNAMTCTSVSPNENIEVIARRGDRIIMRWLLATLEDGAFGFDETPDCMEFRQRSETGKRSAPLVICGDAIPTREFRDGDLDGNGVVLCKGGVIGSAAKAVQDSKGANPATDPKPMDKPRAAPDPDGLARKPAPDAPTQGAAGSRPPASDPKPAASNDTSQHRTYGCSAAPDARTALAPWLLVFALALAALGYRRRAGE